MCHQKQCVPIIYCFHITEHTYTHTHTQSQYIGIKRKEEIEIYLSNFAEKQRRHDSCLFFFLEFATVLSGAHFINSQRGGESGNEFS